MSFAARRLLKQFRVQNYKQIISQSFLHPNQKLNLFDEPPAGAIIDQFDHGRLVTLDVVPDSASQLLYFHGGAFRVPMNEDQLTMIRSIAELSGSRLKIADFPLLPTHSAADISKFAATALQKVAANELPIFLIADSAGAVIAAQLLFQHANQIAGTVLISPWLDLDLNDSEFADRATEDVMLDFDVLKQIATEFKLGLGGLHWIDPYLPSKSLTGSLQIFYGDNELLVPSDKKFVAALEATTNIKVTVTNFRDGFHDYALWENLLETKKTKKQISSFIRDQRDA
ncbi:alpha/beta hydrolase [Lentilactobacillus sp. TOM.63]|uniref:alpha/beta hydrolase n=1 Tax=Lentilactobacillus TaxID=2767893 RepID=UPI001C263E32|nr:MULTISPECIES: alpha/beta hydrolase [Lentilactobacillus]MBU9790307.1 alpha/beta hydrolase [Lentilactobacillus dabitei]MDM7517195.1 alpha/beta hydrolase [Lentilactobacillus sp. TOM.63]